MKKSEEMVQMAIVEKKDEYILPLIEATFNGEGIPLRVRSFYDRAYDGIFVDQKGVAALYVLPRDMERGTRLLQMILQEPDHFSQ